MKADEEVMEVVDNIGNLLAISFRANSSLGNVSPAKKFENCEAPLPKGSPIWNTLGAS